MERRRTARISSCCLSIQEAWVTSYRTERASSGMSRSSLRSTDLVTCGACASLRRRRRGRSAASTTSAGAGGWSSSTASAGRCWQRVHGGLKGGHRNRFSVNRCDRGHVELHAVDLVHEAAHGRKNLRHRRLVRVVQVRLEENPFRRQV